jgi:hypothetical protein
MEGRRKRSVCGRSPQPVSRPQTLRLRLPVCLHARTDTPNTQERKRDAGIMYTCTRAKNSGSPGRKGGNERRLALPRSPSPSPLSLSLSLSHERRERAHASAHGIAHEHGIAPARARTHLDVGLDRRQQVRECEALTICFRDIRWPPSPNPNPPSEKMVPMSCAIPCCGLEFKV